MMSLAWACTRGSRKRPFPGRKRRAPPPSARQSDHLSRNGRPSLRVAVDGGKTEFTARLREDHELARQHDPTLGGFSSIEVSGPAGLVADEAARRRYFGEDLS